MGAAQSGHQTPPPHAYQGGPDRQMEIATMSLLRAAHPWWVGHMA